ncbi:MAG: 2-dehydro-3-deoxygalactonokinase [Rhodobacter sp.]|nr:2-dehydro-3-deoxygalactonokinase [Rhodobacter sp.]
MTPALQPADWIAVDWGTSNLRAWSIGPAGEVLDHAQSDDGMGKLAPADFERALVGLVRPWLGEGVTQAIACGMVGARQGWIEAAYAKVPCPASGGTLTKAPTTDARLDVRIIPGVCQNAPADVMRGEETQIAGYLAQNPDFDGILCLPGTHSKWVHVSAQEIVSFRTFMTGEMFALLSNQSVLRHSVGGDGWDDDAFAEALDSSLSRPEALAGRLFGLRADQLLHQQTPDTARARLSGLLIGAELAAAKPYWLGQPVVLIGATGLAQRYATALRAQGVVPVIADGAALTLAGLTAAHSSLKAKAT